MNFKRIMITTCLLVATIFLSAQIKIENKTSLFNLGIGVAGHYYGSEPEEPEIVKPKMPLFYINFEKLVSEKVSIGVFGSYLKSSISWRGNHKTDINYVFLGAQLNYYIVNSEKLNLYLGGKIGYVKSKLVEDILHYDNNLVDKAIYGVHLGGRYNLGEKFTVFSEVSTTISLLKVGVTFKL